MNQPSDLDHLRGYWQREIRGTRIDYEPLRLKFGKRVHSLEGKAVARLGKRIEELDQEMAKLLARDFNPEEWGNLDRKLEKLQSVFAHIQKSTNPSRELSHLDEFLSDGSSPEDFPGSVAIEPD